MPGKRSSGHRIKIHRSYTVDEAARALKVCKGTVRRYLKDGLPCLNDQRPLLILGQDLKVFLDARRKPKQTCKIDQCFCMSCKAPRKPAFDEVEFHPTKAGRGNIRALCEDCSTVMHKAVSADGLRALGAILKVTDVQEETRLRDGNSLCTNDHFKKEPETYA
ncbi:helix-turn-helix domain-containing protein [Roseibium album]|uniref:helix-turn-helix domain-containing protein n=1 Tax=Roseibium album TaxID=311410 RepID=UPI00391963C3